MITVYTKKDLRDLIDFLNRHPSKDFGILSKEEDVKRFLKTCQIVYVKREFGDIQGIIAKYKTTGEVSRDYIKLNASSVKYALDLLSYLLWFVNKDLYIKIDNNSPFKIPVLEEKKFRFFAGRGEQILMRRQPYVSISREFRSKDEELTGRHSSDNKRPVHIRKQ